MKVMNQFINPKYYHTYVRVADAMFLILQETFQNKAKQKDHVENTVKTSISKK